MIVAPGRNSHAVDPQSMVSKHTLYVSTRAEHSTAYSLQDALGRNLHANAESVRDRLVVGIESVES